MLQCDYTTLMIVSQTLNFKILYHYDSSEKMEESNLLNYIPVAQPKKSCSEWTIYQQSIKFVQH